MQEAEIARAAEYFARGRLGPVKSILEFLVLVSLVTSRDLILCGHTGLLILAHPIGRVLERGHDIIRGAPSVPEPDHELLELVLEELGLGSDALGAA